MNNIVEFYVGSDWFYRSEAALKDVKTLARHRISEFRSFTSSHLVEGFQKKKKKDRFILN